MTDRRFHWTPLEPERERRLHARRRSRRVEVDLTVHCLVDGAAHPRRATNLSTGGLYLRSGRLLPVGARPVLEFRLPGDDKPIRCVGEILHHVRALLPGMNVAFSGITLGDRIRVQRYLDALDPRPDPRLPELDIEPRPAVATAELEADFEFDAELDLEDEPDLEDESDLELDLAGEPAEEPSLGAGELDLELDLDS